MAYADSAPRSAAGLFDRYITAANIRTVEVFIIRLAVISFVIHLALLYLFNHSPSLYQGHPLNYLKAIYTPFSFILVYEVFLLVIILPESMSEFIGKQFEIITLITLRSFFHDIGSVPMQSPIHLWDPAVIPLGYDLIATVAMCALMVVFHKLHPRHRIQHEMQEPLKKFVDLKKTVAVGLVLILMVTSARSFANWIISVIPAFMHNTEFPDPNAFFYADFFSVMIFADVFLLIISLLYDSSFYTVVRNASFVISTILLRLSLGAERPLNHLVAVSAFIFSVAIMLILHLRHKYHATELAPAELGK